MVTKTGLNIKIMKKKKPILGEAPKASRRSFIKHTFTGSTALALGYPTWQACSSERKDDRPGKEPLPASNGVVTRRDISQLEPNDPSLQALKDAVGVLRKRSDAMALAPDGWFAYATLHNMFCFTNSFKIQVHFTWLFFPWHRAYLYFLEKKLQAAIQEPSLALHYWDWTKYPRIPAAYWGKDNPLNDPTRLASEKDQVPDDYMNMVSHLRTPHFKGFGGFPKISPDRPYGEGAIEQSVHNSIHNWIGGNMDNFATASMDPIFYAHHGNIDRVWDSWLEADPSHQNPSDEEFLDYSFEFTDEWGHPVTIKVKDVLDTQKLGYQFESLDFTKTYEGAGEHPRPSNTLPCLVQEVEMNENERSAMATALKNGFRRVIIVMDRFKLPYIPICIRVFIALKNEQQSTPDTEGAEYVTTATILPVGMPDSSLIDKNIIMQAEVGPHLAALVACGLPLQATLEPVKVPGRELTAVPVEISNIRIQFDDEVG